MTMLGLVGIHVSPSEAVTPEAVPLGLALVVVAALYLLAEVVQLNFEVGRHGLAVTISDLPLVMGVFILPPELLLTACLAGTLSIRSFRHTPISKTLFNLSVNVAEIGLASVLLHHVTMRVDPVLDDRGWWIPYLLVLLVNALSLAAVFITIGNLEGPVTSREAVTMILTVLVSGAFSATLAVISLQVLRQGTYGLVLLVVVSGMLAMIYRSYAAMLRRHADLGQLMSATARLSDARGELAETLVNEARRLVQADKAMLLRGEQLETDTLIGDDGAALLPERTRVPAQRAWLAKHRHDDALLIHVGNSDGRIGTLVITDRLGNSRSFTHDDLSRVQMLVRHAEALWSNGLLTQRLRFDAAHDSLTGLANRNQLLVLLNQRLQNTVLVTDRRDDAFCDASLLLLDLNRFKEINDSLGHPAGDNLLAVVAERLRTVTPDTSHVARLGGDEFAILLPPASVVEVMRTAERVTDAISEPVLLGRTRVEVGCAVGVSLVPQDGTDATTVLRRADVAMYASKRSGRITRYRPSLDTASVDQLEILGDLRRSLEDGFIRPWFQPKVDLRDGRVVGFEALARWEHPTRGLVLPDEFVPLAENGGFAAPLTSSMLARSLQECRVWNAWAPGIGVSVNVASRQLEDSEFPRMVTRVLRESGVAPELLTLEITEGSVVSGSVEAIRTLNDLRDLGVRISVDDFGTGYSALGYLHRLPVDEVKIDKSFVLPMAREREAAMIVSAIVDLSTKLKLVTVAEGVEDKGIADQLLALGCTIGQGFLVSRALPSHRVLGWLRDYVPHTATPAGRQPDDAASS